LSGQAFCKNQHEAPSIRFIFLEPLLVRGRLDSIDIAILRELQDDGSITNVELARRVGLSAPPCLRRVRALEEAGYIKGYRALLTPKMLGFEVVFFAMVQLATQGKAQLAEFQRRVTDWPAVRECWSLSGEVDFILKCVAPNLTGLQRVVDDLTELPNVRNVRSALSLDVIKDEPLVPMEMAPVE
jgi:DNA-binding Lrp family transcriptional regulator